MSYVGNMVNDNFFHNSKIETPASILNVCVLLLNLKTNYHIMVNSVKGQWQNFLGFITIAIIC